MSYIQFPADHQQYFKHFSHWNAVEVCSMDSSQGRKPRQWISAHLEMAYCSEQEHGIDTLKALIESGEGPVVDNYPGFFVIRIGKPKTIYLFNEKAIEFMAADLKDNHGILAYWDYGSIAFISNAPDMLPVIREFLTDCRKYTYCTDHNNTPIERIGLNIEY